MHQQKKLTKKHILNILSLLLTISASATLSIHLNNLMTASKFPPGTAAALYYKAATHGLASTNLPPQDTIFTAFTSFTSKTLTVDHFLSLKLTSILILSLVPLATFLLTTIVTENMFAATASAWLTAFTPLTVAPILIGNYGAVLGLLFSTLYITFLLMYLKKPATRTLLLLLTAETLTVLGNIHAATITLSVVVTLTFLIIQGKKKKDTKKLLFLSLIVFTVPFLALFAVGNPLQTLNSSFQVNPVFWVQDPWFSLPLTISAAIGAYTLFKKTNQSTFLLLLVSTMIPLASSPIPGSGSLHIFASPFLAVFSASTLLWLREAFSLKETKDENDETVIEITVDVPKTAAIIIIGILLVSTVNSGYNTSTWLYNQNSVSKYFKENEVLPAVQWINKNIPEETVLSSRLAVAAWLEALTGRRVLGFRGNDEALLSETLDSTSFRILTSSLMVDEWEPFSVSKAPRISCYDGQTYKPMAYIDDSFVRVKLIKDGKEWIESPYRAIYKGYKWISKTPPEIILVQNFETPGLLFEKTLTVSTLKPVTNVRYKVTPKQNVELVGIQFPVRIEPWRKVSTLETTSNGTKMIVDGRQTEIIFSGNIISLKHTKYDEGHAMVTAEFKPEGTIIDVNATISITSDKRSTMPLWAVYTPNLIKTHHVKYVVAESGTMGFMDRAITVPAPTLVVKDSFNRITFEQGSTRWVEAPYNAKVLFDESASDGTREIGYETCGLHINKTITSSEHSISIFYTIAPKKDMISLTTMNLTLWIDWNVQLLNYTTQENTVTLELSTGKLEVTFVGNPVNLEVGPDPTWGQNRIQATLRLNGRYDQVGVNISSPRPLLLKYRETTRPDMKGDDQIDISIDPNIFRIVFKQGALIICKTNP